MALLYREHSVSGFGFWLKSVIGTYHAALQERCMGFLAETSLWAPGTWVILMLSTEQGSPAFLLSQVGGSS